MSEGFQFISMSNSHFHDTDIVQIVQKQCDCINVINFLRSCYIQLLKNLPKIKTVHELSVRLNTHLIRDHIKNLTVETWKGPSQNNNYYVCPALHWYTFDFRL